MSHCSCHDKPQHSLLPAAYRILSITRHTPLEWNFRVAVDFPAHWGQFVEVSLPRVGEAPISVSDYGDPVDTLRHKPLLVVAGGTGVAPVKGLMRYFVENPQEIGQLDMILGYKNRDCVLYKEEMATWRGKHNLVLTLDEGEADDRYQIGRVTDRLADMDYLYRKNAAAKRAQAGANLGGLRTPDGLLRREVRPLPYGRSVFAQRFAD